MNSDDLIEENKVLKEQLALLKEEKKSWGEIVDKKVDNWFQKHKDDVDIGRISVFQVFGQKYEIDILPDEMEKAIYKKCIKIMLSMIYELNLE